MGFLERTNKRYFMRELTRYLLAYPPNLCERYQENYHASNFASQLQVLEIFTFIILSTKQGHQLSQPRPVSSAMFESCIGAYPPVTSLEFFLFCLVLLLFRYFYSQFPQLSFACFVYLQANSFTPFCCCLPIRSCVQVRFKSFHMISS